MKSKSGYVYLLKALHDNQLFKIGRAKNPKDRMRTFGIKLPFEVEFELLIQTEDMYYLEKKLHSKFKEVRLSGEWFRLSDDDVQYMRDLANEDLVTVNETHSIQVEPTTRSWEAYESTEIDKYAEIAATWIEPELSLDFNRRFLTTEVS